MNAPPVAIRILAPDPDLDADIAAAGFHPDTPMVRAPVPAGIGWRENV